MIDEQLKQELKKFHEWMDSHLKEIVTEEEEEEWKRIEKQGNMST